MGALVTNSSDSLEDQSSTLKININFKKPIKAQLKQLLSWSLADIRQIYAPYRKRKSSPILTKSEFCRFIRMSQMTSFYIYNHLVRNQHLIAFEVMALLILTSHTNVNYKIQFMFNVFDLKSQKNLQFSQLILLFKSLIRGYSYLTDQQPPTNSLLQKYAQTMFSRADINNDHSLELAEILSWFLGNQEGKQFFQQFTPSIYGKQEYYIFNSFAPYNSEELQILFERIGKVYRKQKLNDFDFTILKNPLYDLSNFLSNPSSIEKKNSKNGFQIVSSNGEVIQKFTRTSFARFEPIRDKHETPKNKSSFHMDQTQNNLKKGFRISEKENVKSTISGHLTFSKSQFLPPKKLQNIIIIKGKAITKKEVFDLREYFDRITGGKKDMHIEDFIDSFNQQKYNHMKSVAASLYNFLDKNQTGKVTFLDLIVKLYPNLTSKNIKIILGWSDHYNQIFNLDSKVKDTRNNEDSKKRNLPRNCLPRFKQIFNLFDRQKKGFITFQNMRAVLGDVCTYKEMVDLFEESDENKDGKLTLQQFVHVLLPPDLDIEGLH